jgi:hypothetical protein
MPYLTRRKDAKYKQRALFWNENTRRLERREYTNPWNDRLTMFLRGKLPV